MFLLVCISSMVCISFGLCFFWSVFLSVFLLACAYSGLFFGKKSGYKDLSMGLAKKIAVRGFWPVLLSVCLQNEDGDRGKQRIGDEPTTRPALMTTNHTFSINSTLLMISFFK